MAAELVGSPSVRYADGHPERGQSHEDGFDCSGFVRQVILRAGLYIPDYIAMDGTRRQIRHASEFWDHYGMFVGTDPEPGDLIFFSRHGVMPTHVGIVRDAESYIHAPGVDGSRVAIAGIRKKLITPRPGAERTLYETNPIGFKASTVPLSSPHDQYHQRLA